MDKNNVVVSNDNTKEQVGKYRHKFKTPFTYEGKTYTELELNFEKLKGKHLVDIENEMAAVGEYALSPEISTSFLYRLAAKAAGIGSDVIINLPISDFGKIKNVCRDFLVKSGL